MAAGHLLVPTVKVAAVSVAAAGSLLVGEGYSGSVSLGSIITAAMVVVLGGVFTLRNNLKTFWKELAEERDAKIHQLERQSDEAALARAAFAEQQRDLRHKLQNDVATLVAQLELERAKTDLTGVIARIEAMEALLTNRQEMFEGMAAGLDRQSELLAEMVEGLHRFTTGRGLSE